MRASKQGAWLNEPTAEELERQQDFQRVIGMSVYRDQASRAGKLMAAYRASSAQKLMLFQDFQKPSKRNRILREFNREPMHFPFDPVPAKRRKTRRKQRPRRKP